MNKYIRSIIVNSCFGAAIYYGAQSALTSFQIFSSFICWFYAIIGILMIIAHSCESGRNNIWGKSKPGYWSQTYSMFDFIVGCGLVFLMVLACHPYLAGISILGEVMALGGRELYSMETMNNRGWEEFADKLAKYRKEQAAQKDLDKED